MKLGLLSPFVEEWGEVGNYRGGQSAGFVFGEENGDRLARWVDFAFVFVGFWRFVTWEIESGISLVGLGLITVEVMGDRVNRIGEVGCGDTLGLEAIFLEALERFKDGL
jgi:hypothetical protein